TVSSCCAGALVESRRRSELTRLERKDTPRVLHEDLAERCLVDAGTPEPRHDGLQDHVDARAAVFPGVLLAGKIRREADSVLEAGLEHGKNCSHVLICARIVRPPGMVETGVGPTFGNRDGSGGRIVLDVVQVADHYLAKIRTG